VELSLRCGAVFVSGEWQQNKAAISTVTISTSEQLLASCNESGWVPASVNKSRRVTASSSAEYESLFQRLHSLASQRYIVTALRNAWRTKWMWLRRTQNKPHRCSHCRYNSVLDACCLDVDMARLSAGDSTLIGDRGVTLSGGQRQRVSLARAVYSDRDVYLLDDPLAAVDPDVALAVFRRVVLDLLSDKTVLLVTHQLQVIGIHQLVPKPNSSFRLTLSPNAKPNHNPNSHLRRSPHLTNQLINFYLFYVHGP